MSGMLDARTALIVVDLQQGTMANARAFSSPDWLTNAAMLVEAFRSVHLPVVIATSLGTPPGRTTYAEKGRSWSAEAAVLVPEIETSPSDVPVSRHALSAFAGTDLQEILRSGDVTEVVIVGIATSYGIESTARAAYDLGFSVVVVTDAIADLQQASHDHALTAIFPVLGRIATVDDVMAELHP